MSAKTEKLVEQINKLRKFINVAEESCVDTLSAEKELKRLTEELNAANRALNEGVIKG